MDRTAYPSRILIPIAIDAAPWRSCLLPVLIVVAIGLNGCANSPEKSTSTNEAKYTWGEVTYDPLERYNRWVHSFNMTADEYLLRPLAVTYKERVPAGVRAPVGNFLNNLREPLNAINYYFQGAGEQGTRTLTRFFVNSTIGFLGLFDVAGAAGLERKETDLGLTLGTWGTPEGPYIVLPFLGPSTLRASSGLTIQYLTRDYHSVYSWADVEHHYRHLATGLYGLHLRADLLSLDELMEQSGADPYIFMRESYLQNRRDKLKEDEWGEWE